jgi:AhpD family alkylhydroperoxidase
MKLQVFDPPMCCSTGVCGPTVDPELVRFAADLDGLARAGVTVERYNVAQQPAAFAATSVVKDTLAREGNDCLPLTLVDGVIVCKGRYPSRAELAAFAGVESSPTLFTNAVKELVAIGAAIAANCEPCFKHHYNEARKLGVSREDMILAVNLGQSIKENPARAVRALAVKALGEAAGVTAEPRREAGGCGGSEAQSSGGGCCG